MSSIVKAPDAGSLFIFGLGYTGLEMAKQLHRNGWRVCGTCRTGEKQRTLVEKYGLEAHVFDSSSKARLSGAGLEALYQATHLLSAVPPAPDLYVDTVLSEHGKDIETSEYLRWIGYLSSTGVYGDHRGAWVKESSETFPVGSKAVARLEAERRWLQLQVSASVQIFRLGGIYGPGRSILDAIGKPDSELSKRQLARDKRRFISRIHVADVCQVLQASIRSPRHGRIYNVVDDDPAPRSEVLSFAKQLSGMERDEDEAAKAQETTAAAEKRVRNRRIKEELGVQLRYPSYVQGLSELQSRARTAYSDSLNS